MTEAFYFHMTPEALDRYLRSNTATTGAPTFFGRHMLAAVAKAGLDVDRLKSDGIIAETQRIPTK